MPVVSPPFHHFFVCIPAHPLQVCILVPIPDFTLVAIAGPALHLL